MTLSSAVLPRPQSVPRPPAARSRPNASVVQFVVALVAVGARLTMVLRHGALHGNYGYDAGVYFAAGDAFAHGRLPYRDFVLIHPPVVMLVLSPFGALTRVTSDEAAFSAAILACTVLGGVNAVLVVRVTRRLGLGVRSATAAGLFYALWFGAIGSEFLIKLEPLGNLFLLLGLLAVLRVLDGGGRVWAVVAGIALGATVSVKIWWIVPFVAIVAWLAWRTRSARTVGAVLAGAVGVSVLVDGPFFVASPKAMWSSVVLDQVTRGSVAGSPLVRLTDLSSVTRLTGAVSQPAMALISLVTVVAGVWVGRRAWSVPVARPAVVLCALQVVLLLAAPSWFPYYADFLAVSAAVTVGAAASRVPGRHRFAIPPGGVVAAAVAAITLPALALGLQGVRPFAGAAVLARAAAGSRCVLSDSPMGLIELNALSRSFTNGCANWVDVTGRTYGPDRSSRPRIANARWQRDLVGYLRSGDAAIVVRGGGTGLSPATYRALGRDGVLTRAGGHTLYRVVP